MSERSDVEIEQRASEATWGIESCTEPSAGQVTRTSGCGSPTPAKGVPPRLGGLVGPLRSRTGRRPARTARACRTALVWRTRRARRPGGEVALDDDVRGHGSLLTHLTTDHHHITHTERGNVVARTGEELGFACGGDRD